MISMSLVWNFNYLIHSSHDALFKNMICFVGRWMDKCNMTMFCFLYICSLLEHPHLHLSSTTSNSFMSTMTQLPLSYVRNHSNRVQGKGTACILWILLIFYFIMHAKINKINLKNHINFYLYIIFMLLLNFVKNVFD